MWRLKIRFERKLALIVPMIMVHAWLGFLDMGYICASSLEFCLIEYASLSIVRIEVVVTSTQN